jgi:hypothetical protein
VKLKGWKVWQTNKYKHLLQQRGAKAAPVAVGVVKVADMVARAAGTAVRGVIAAQVAVDLEVPAGVLAASANISAKRKFASSASRRWTSSTTSAQTFCRSSCKSAARFCRVA